MLRVTVQNKNIGHRLQIGKDQKCDSHGDDDGHQLNTRGDGRLGTIGFIDDISIFANKPEGMQTLIKVV